MTQFISITTLHYLENGFLNGDDGQGNVKTHKKDSKGNPYVSAQCFRKQIKEMIREQGKYSISTIGKEAETSYREEDWDFQMFGGMLAKSKKEKKAKGKSKEVEEIVEEVKEITDVITVPSFIHTSPLTTVGKSQSHFDFGVKFSPDQKNSIYNTEYITNTFFKQTSVIPLKDVNTLGSIPVKINKDYIITYLDCLQDYTHNVGRRFTNDLRPVAVLATLSNSANPITANTVVLEGKDLQTKYFDSLNASEKVKGLMFTSILNQNDSIVDINEAFNIIRSWVK